ncbi:MAG: hypothetical protein WBK37_02775, partial [Kiritimatiellia bacterium]
MTPPALGGIFPPRTAPTYDWIIRGGLVADGRGGELVRADVALRGDRIAAIGELPATATHEYD